MKKITIYTKNWCPYSVRAKALLSRKGLSYTNIDVTYDSKLEREMQERSGRTSVPQIFVGEAHVGGYDDLIKYVSEHGIADAVTDKHVLAFDRMRA